MRFQVKGINRKSGEAKTLVIDAESEAEALEKAGKGGYVVEGITKVRDTPPQPPKPASPEPKFVEVDKPLSYNQGKLIILLLVLGLNLPILSWLRPAPKWEYRIESPSDIEFRSRLDELGRQGWELVSARRALSGSDEFAESRYEVIFKRPR